MVKKYITWIAPTTAEGYTHVRVEKSSNGGVSYAEFTVSNDPDYTADGLVVTDTDAVDLVGASGHWYKIRFYDKTHESYSDYSLPMRGSDFRGYCTITDIRNYTNVQSSEYNDAAVQMMIDTVTSSIDLYCNRTWQGTEDATDVYLDGNGKNFMFIDNDLQAITSLAIDDDGDGVYTAISSTLYYPYLDRGSLLLDKDAEVSTFYKGRRTVKVSYTHGYADPPDEVRHLAILSVANMMKMDATRTAIIDEIKMGLRVNAFENTEVGANQDGAY
jgi:hypothetical protein